jgi:hypothetical protein
MLERMISLEKRAEKQTRQTGALENQKARVEIVVFRLYHRPTDPICAVPISEASITRYHLLMGRSESFRM